MKSPKVYLAGPDVFLAEPEAMFAKKKAICERHGLTGLSPLDSEADAAGAKNAETAFEIGRKNEALMNDCDLVIANMTPFRGPSMDVGTAYEMGYMRGKGKAVFGYSNDDRPYRERVEDSHADDEIPGQVPASGASRQKDPRDNNGMAIEDFGLRENLMLEWAVHDNGGSVQTADSLLADPLGEIGAFEAAVIEAQLKMEEKEQAAMDEKKEQALFGEWETCREALAAFDKVLFDFRKYGFSLVTILISASGFAYVKAELSAYAIIGIYVALLLLLYGLFRQDRVQQVFIRSTAMRAIEIERDLKMGLTTSISRWSEKVGSGTWGHVLYCLFCLANCVLAIGGLFGTKAVTEPTDMLNFLCAGIALLAIFVIIAEHEKSAELERAFRNLVENDS